MVAAPGSEAQRAHRGIPLEDGYRLYELTEIMNTGLIGDKRAMKAGAEMFGYSTELVARKRADPRDDIATFAHYEQLGEVCQAVAERKPKRWRRNAARRSGIAIRLNRANGTYSAA